MSLHLLAREGNLSGIMQWVASGKSIDETDILGTTALHLAAMYSHHAVAAYLIQQGAALNPTTYAEYVEQEDARGNTEWVKCVYTPLDLAFKYAPNAAIITTLLQHGARPDNWEHALYYLFEDLVGAEEAQNYPQFDLTLQKIEILSEILPTVLIDSGQPIPLSTLLLSLSTHIDNPLLYQRMIEAVEHVHLHEAWDFSESHMLAKNLLHAFPSAHKYDFIAGKHHSVLAAQGHVQPIVTDLSAQSIHAYYAYLQSQPTPYLKEQIFAQLRDLFEVAAKSIRKGALEETTQQLYERYLSGETILLHSHWDGHFLDIILDKQTNLVMIANGGNRYHALPAGLNAYHPQFDVQSNDIYLLLNNENQMHLEFKYFYDLGLLRDDNYSIETPNQAYGNCGWYSQQIAEQGFIFLELHKALGDYEIAKDLSQMWYAELNDFHQTFVLKAYLEKPALEVAALGDILIDYHSNPQTAQALERVDLILDNVLSIENLEAFEIYYQAHQEDFSPELKQFMQDKGYTLHIEEIIIESPIAETLALLEPELQESENISDVVSDMASELCVPPPPLYDFIPVPIEEAAVLMLM